jgi:hypothetical protein
MKRWAYYVALQKRKIWRVTKTQNDGRAEAVYSDLAKTRAPQSQATACQPEQQNAIRELRTGRAAAQAQLQPRQTRVQELQTQSDGDLPAPVK